MRCLRSSILLAVPEPFDFAPPGPSVAVSLSNVQGVHLNFIFDPQFAIPAPFFVLQFAAFCFLPRNDRNPSSTSRLLSLFGPLFTLKRPLALSQPLLSDISLLTPVFRRRSSRLS